MGDERKRKRMESNRESARRSRIKKQQQLQSLISEIDVFKRRNFETGVKIDEMERRRLMVETEIEMVAVEKMRLEQRLEELLSCVNNDRREEEGGGIRGGRVDVIGSVWGCAWLGTSPLMTSRSATVFRT